jgi:hypothetical protein
MGAGIVSRNKEEIPGAAHPETTFDRVLLGQLNAGKTFAWVIPSTQ